MIRKELNIMSREMVVGKEGEGTVPAVEIKVTRLKEGQRLFIQLLQMMSFDWIGGNRDVMISHWVSGVLSVLRVSNHFL